MAADARAKYLNSPETPLFDKGRSLYNQGPAREAGKNQPLIVAEGYMDVIALVEAGFEATVAPLGTAITEDQLRLLWRISPEPILALDGDRAGLRAAMRVIDLALPMLEAGNSLRFALMPDGQDPDDLIRAGGADAMQTCLDAALPMVDLLWRRETEGKSFDSPERKAALDKALREKLKLIRDPSIRRHYGDAIKDMRWHLFRPQRGGGQARRKSGWAATPVPLASTKSSTLVAGGAQSETALREKAILAVCLKTPAIIAEFETGLEAMDCTDGETSALRHSVLKHQTADNIHDAVAQELGSQVLENLFAMAHVSITPAVRHAGDVDMARLTIAEELTKLEARRGLSLEIADAARDLDGVADEGVTWRLSQAAEARNKADRSQTEDNTDFEVGENGALIDREEKSAFTELLEGISFAKGRK
jgi:DNA primase